MSDFHAEVQSGQRFQFGKNWSSFLKLLDDERIREAENSLKEMLGVESLAGKTFLDVGSGSGLFSLAAKNLGAKVTSFDYDPQSVACARELKRRYFPADENWAISEGSALDAALLRSLGQFDITYAWGVLHHTGQMWRALDLVSGTVKPGGKLFIMIYEDMGRRTRVWLEVKRIYCSGALGRIAVTALFLPYLFVRGVIADIRRGENPLQSFEAYKKKRGMSRFHDWVDWLGGYPFEFATNREIVDFHAERGFRVLRIEGAQYVFERDGARH